jgi:hypothetical protein
MVMLVRGASKVYPVKLLVDLVDVIVRVGPPAKFSVMEAVLG